MKGALPESAFSPDELTDMREHLNHCVSILKSGDPDQKTPTVKAIGDLIVLCSDRNQVAYGTIFAAVMTILSRGDIHKLAWVLNELAGECSPRQPEPWRN